MIEIASQFRIVVESGQLLTHPPYLDTVRWIAARAVIQDLVTDAESVGVDIERGRISGSGIGFCCVGLSGQGTEDAFRGRGFVMIWKMQCLRMEL